MQIICLSLFKVSVVLELSLPLSHIAIESKTEHVRVSLQVPVRVSTNANISFKIAIGTARQCVTAASSDLFSTMVSSLRLHRA